MTVEEDYNEMLSPLMLAQCQIEKASFRTSSTLAKAQDLKRKMRICFAELTQISSDESTLSMLHCGN